MHKSHQFGLSFEFFPPKTAEQKVILLNTQEQLRQLDPDFFSVTFGAGGSTITATADTVLELNQHETPKVIPHLSCMGGTPEEIKELLDKYLEHGITDILALRGDVPSGMGSVGYFRYANELIEFIHETYPNTFKITVGCYPEVHPETESLESEIKYFKQKTAAGVERAITQFFFNPEAYFNFIDHCEKAGIDTPITPGIMPITNFANIKRFCGFCGTDMPRWLQYKLQSYGDDRKSIQQFGTEFTIKLCQQLLDQGVNGIHFYTLNRAKATLDVVKALQ
ncbi:methylenetetrahydrofolate reductase [NAD(P)H] [Marinicella meishanensis]|uniref:methylenetetrahydrofolate reductase [NAD(P)H] n=1 Tax=Marinicella meishanensis TaxID=2873263 RepID=UPI001CC03BBC|nr:methylenetetrahydrofolate reductase [NAD(P)H] [Marinicella sp. NBU2979]